MTTSFQRAARWFLSDARHFQIAFLLTFLCYGIAVLQWDAELWRYAIIAGTCLGAQALFAVHHGLEWRTLKSAAVTMLGLCLLFKSGSPLTLVLGAFVAIASKFVLRIRGKHIFNPANIGIVAAVLLTGDAWVSPGQWGSGAALVFLVGAAGLMVVLRVGRIDTSVAFLLTFATLHFCRNVLYLGWGVDVWLHQLTNGSLLLFTFFMITDPATTPSAPKARIGWSVLVAVVAFLFSWKLFVNAAPVWALFFISASTPLVDLIWKGERFQWVRPVRHAPIEHLTPSTINPLPTTNS